MSGRGYQWTLEQDAAIQAEYHTTGRVLLAQRFGVHAHNVGQRSAKLGIVKPKEPRWSETELYRLEANYPVLGMMPDTIKQWAKLLPGRTSEAIGIKANRMGLLVGAPSSRVANVMTSVNRAARDCGVDREIILRVALELGETPARRGLLTMVSQKVLDEVRRQYPSGTRDIRKAGYLSLKRAAPLIGVDRRTLEQAANHDLAGPLREALEGIKLHRAGKYTYLNPHDIGVIRGRLKAQRTGALVKAVAVDEGCSVHTARVRYLERSRYAIVGGHRQRVVAGWQPLEQGAA